MAKIGKRAREAAGNTSEYCVKLKLMAVVAVPPGRYEPDTGPTWWRMEVGRLGEISVPPEALRNGGRFDLGSAANKKRTFQTVLRAFRNALSLAMCIERREYDLEAAMQDARENDLDFFFKGEVERFEVEEDKEKDLSFPASLAPMQSQSRH